MHGSDRSLYFDLTDLFEYMSTHANVTGIQRVVLELALPVMRMGGRGAIFDANESRWLSIDADSFLNKAEQINSLSSQTRTSWSTLSQSLKSTAKEIVFSNETLGVIIVLLGANWEDDRLFLNLRNTKRQTKVALTCLVHDVVPMNYPEYCINQEHVDKFKRWFASTINEADIILTTARHNKHEIDRACVNAGLTQRQMQFCSLNGHDVSRKRPHAHIRVDIAHIARTNFILFVGTIEPRKDHLFIISCWRTLIECFAADTVPVLVLVGSLGWQYEPILRAINDPTLRDHVRLLTDVGESDLQFLYDQCLFTVYNSFHEGWGLPVTESIARGKVPLVPGHSSLVEAGGESAIYFEPRSHADFISKAVRLIQDPAYRKEAADRVRRTNNLRSWREISHDLVDQIVRYDADRKAIGNPAQIGKIYLFNNDLTKQSLRDYAIAESMRTGGWHEMEHWGCWTAHPNFGIVFRIADELLDDAGTQTSDDQDPYIVYLAIYKNHKNCKLTYRTNLRSDENKIQLGIGRCMLSIVANTEQGGRICIEFTQDSLVDLLPIESTVDERTIGVGIESIMICRQSAVAARLEMLEHFHGFKGATPMSYL